MCRILKAPENWNPTKSKHFTAYGEHGKKWVVFIYDEKIN